MTETSETFAKLQQALDKAGQAFNQSAVAKLSAALKAASQKTVSLAVGPDPDWDPHKHPRLADGTFAPLHKGVFLFGKVKSAFYHQPGSSDDGKAFKLQPGEALYKTATGKMSNAPLIKTPDGKWLNASGGVNLELSEATTKKVKQWEAQGKLEKLDEAPVVAIPAPTQADALTALNTPVTVGDSLNAAQVALLPVGSQITDAKGKSWTLKQSPISKTPYWSGEDLPVIAIWAGDKPVLLTKLGDAEKGPAMKNGVTAVIQANAPATSDKLKGITGAGVLPKPGDMITPDLMETLPTGAHVSVAGGAKYTKLDNGNWQPVGTKFAYPSKNFAKVTVYLDALPESQPPKLEDWEQQLLQPENQPMVGDYFDEAGLQKLPVGSQVKVPVSGNVYTKQPDGQWVNASPHGSGTPVAIKQGTLVYFGNGTAPAKKVPAKKKIPLKKAAVKAAFSPSLSVQGMKELPVGSVIKSKNSGKEYTKIDTGKFQSNAALGDFDPEDFTPGAMSLVSTPGASTAADSDVPEVGDKITTAQLDALPVGAVIDNLSDGYTYEKIDAGHYKIITPGGDFGSTFSAVSLFTHASWKLKSLSHEAEHASPESSGTGASPQHAAQDIPQTGDLISSENDYSKLDALPVGAQIQSPKNNLATKQSDGKWAYPGQPPGNWFTSKEIIGGLTGGDSFTVFSTGDKASKKFTLVTSAHQLNSLDQGDQAVVYDGPNMGIWEKKVGGYFYPLGASTPGLLAEELFSSGALIYSTKPGKKDSESPKVGDTVGPDQLDSLPVGTTITSPTDSSFVYDKKTDGKWYSKDNQSVGWQSSQFGPTSVWQITSEAAVEDQPSASFNVGDGVSSSQLKDLPVGAQITLNNYTYQKTADTGAVGGWAYLQADGSLSKTFPEDLTKAWAKTTSGWTVTKMPSDFSESSSEPSGLPKVGSVLKDGVNGLPVGSVIITVTGSVKFQKTDAGWSYLLSTGDLDSTTHGDYEFHGNVWKLLSLPQSSQPSSSAVGHATKEDIHSAPKGTKAVLHYPSGDVTAWTKKGDGSDALWDGKAVTVQPWSVESALEVPDIQKGSTFVLEYPDGSQKTYPAASAPSATKPIKEMSTQEFDALAPGTKIHSGSLTYQRVGGGWSMLKANGELGKPVPSGTMLNGIKGDNLAWSIVDQAAVSGPKPGDIVQPSEFNNFPVGTSVTWEHPAHTEHPVWEKQFDGSWKRTDKPGLAPINNPELFTESGTWKIASVGSQTTPDPEVPGKNKLTAHDPNDAPEPNGEWTPILGHIAPTVSNANGFTHPVSKEKFPLGKGDQLLQHKITPESFAVMGPDGSKKFQINKNGKQTKWSPHIPKSNFKIVYTAQQDSWNYDPHAGELPDGSKSLKGNVFTHPVSGDKFTIGSDEVLKQHNFTPNSYLVTALDGTPLYQINVKGKKYKVGGNLKPANYFELYNGKTHAVKGNPVHEFEVQPAMGYSQVIDKITGAQPFDTVTVEGAVFTKTTDGATWVGPGGFGVSAATLGDTAWKAAYQQIPADLKSDNGVPLEAQNLNDHLKSIPVNSTLTANGLDIGQPNFSVTKTGEGSFDYHYGDSTITGQTSGWVALKITQDLSLAQKKNLKVNEPKIVKPDSGMNKNGLPVWSSEPTLLSAKLLQSATEGSSLDYTDPNTGNVQHWAVFHGGSWHTNKDYAYLGSADTNSSPALAQLVQGAVPDYLQAELSISKVEPVKAAGGAQTKVESMAQKAEADAKTEAKQQKAALKKLLTAVKPDKTFSNATELNDYIAEQNYDHSASAGQAYVDIHHALMGPDAGMPGSYYDSYPPDPLLGITWGDDPKWSGLSNSERYIKAWSQPQVADAITQAIANINQGKKDAGLNTSEKSKLTKKVGKLTQMLKYAKTAQALSVGQQPAPEFIPDQEFSWGTKKTFQFDPSAALSYFNQKILQLKFTEQSAGLGWDPYNGTSDQYYGWLVDHDHPEAAYLSEDSLKQAALNFMGAPDYKLDSYSLKNLMKPAKVASFKLKVSEAMADANGEDFHPADGIPDYVWPPGDEDLSLTPDRWNSIKYALAHPEEFPDPDGTMLSSFPNGNLGLAASAIPDSAKRALVGAYQSGISFNLTAVADYLLKSGLWYDGKLVYEDPNGKFPVSPGMKVYKSTQYGSDYLYFVPKDLSKLSKNYYGATQVDAYSTSEAGWTTMSYSPDNPPGELVYTAPYTITKADAIGDGVTFTDEQWNKLEALEGTVPPEPLSGSQQLALKEVLKGYPVSAADLGLKAQKLMLLYPEAKNLIAYKDKQGSYRVNKPNQADWSSYVDSKAPQFSGSIDFMKKLNPATIYTAGQLDGLDKNQLLQLADVAGDTVTDSDLTMPQLRSAVIKALTAWTDSRSQDAAAYVPQIGLSSSLKSTPKKNVGGGRPKTFWVDDAGNEYMFKPDNEEKFRPDTEQAANEIGTLFGFKVPASSVRNLNGDYGIVQAWSDASGNLDGKSPEDLTERQLTEVLTGHPLDWAIANHDTHSGNFLIGPDGEHIKIDLGQAWKALGKDKLAVDWALPGNVGDSWYDSFYHQVQKGKIDKDELNRISKAVLTKASTISTARDEQFQQKLEFAFQNRSFYPKGYDKAKFIDLAMQRKHDTLKDFYGFYQDLYKQGGYDWPFQSLEDFRSSKTDSDAHLRVSQEFADEVKQNSIHGKSVFFAGPDVEDGHIFFYTTQGKGGSTTLRGETKFRHDADQIISSWIKDHGGQGAVPNPPNVILAESSGPTVNYLPDVSGPNSVLIKFGKTVGHHASDGEYNKQTLKEAADQYDALNQQVAALEDAVHTDPLFVSKGYSNPASEGGVSPSGVSYSAQSVQTLPTFETAHQQAAWHNWANRWLADYKMIDEAKNSGTQPPTIAKPENWSQYTPPAGIDTSGKPKPVEKLTTAEGVTFTKYSDFNYVGPDGPIGEEAYAAFAQNAGATVESLVPATKAEPLPLAKVGDNVTPEQIAATPDGSLFKIKAGWVYKKDGSNLVPVQTPTGEEWPGHMGSPIKKLDPAKGWTMVEPKAQQSVQVSPGKVYNVKTEDSYSNPKTSDPLTTDGVGIDKGRQPGHGGPMYAITSPDNPGVTLRYLPWGSTSHGSGNYANKGQMQIEMTNWDGSEAQMESTLDMIRDMGVELDPADQKSLESLYWDMMRGLLKNRGQSNAWENVEKKLDAIPSGLPDEQRTQKIKEAFAQAWGMDRVEKADFMPHFSQFRDGLPTHDSPLSGHPYWMRPDFDVEEAKSAHGTLLSSLPSREDKSMKYILSGAFASSEDKIRYSGQFNPGGDYGMYNTPVEDRDNGGSQYGMFRQGATQSNGIYAEPYVLGRTSTYAVDNDNFGDVENRGNSPWELSGMYQQTVEMNVKYSMSLFDDIAIVVYGDSGMRDNAIKYFKGRGVDSIRGIPIEERLVNNSTQAEKTAKKVWAIAAANQHLQEQFPDDPLGSTRDYNGREYVKRANGMWVPAQVWKE